MTNRDSRLVDNDQYSVEAIYTLEARIDELEDQLGNQ